METQDRRGSKQPARGSFPELFGSILLFFNLALAYPLLDLTGRNAEFFVAHDASRAAILLLIVLLTVAVPVVIASVVVVVERASPVAARGLHLVVLALLVAALAVQVTKQFGFESNTPGAAVVGLAVLLGGAGAAAYQSLPSVRAGTRFGLVVPLLVMAAFSMTDAQRLLFPDDAAARGVRVEDPTPVVMVVFDEFPTTSLLDDDLDIDADLFPHFARLGREGNWYRNATTVDTHTRWAVPALLAGYRPSRDSLPTVGDHPNNLFRLLGESYDVHAYESMTALCPEDVCTEELSPSLTTVIAGIASDLGIVSAHLLAPTRWTTTLPPLDEGWANFDGARTGELAEEDDGEHGDEAEGEEAFTWDKDARLGDLVGRFRAWTSSLPSTGQDDVLAFAHSLLAHKPWRYLPTGQEYPNVMFTAIQGGIWTDDPWLAAQGYQRHLMQVQAADSMLGELLSALEANGMYDRAMIVVAADHGISLRAGVNPRKVVDETLIDIAAVPLFVKYPEQTKGGVVTHPVQTIDVVPTILDVLDAEPDQELEGRSLRAVPDEQRARVISSGAGDGAIELPPSIDDHLRHAATYKRDLLGLSHAKDRSTLYHLAPPGTGRLIGRPADDLVSNGQPPFSASLRIADAYEDVDPDAATLPALIGGDLDTRLPGSERVTIAVAVNGRIAGVTLTLNRGSRQRPTEFSAMVDPSVFDAGPNEVSFYVVVEDSEGDMGLLPLPRVDEPPA